MEHQRAERRIALIDRLSAACGAEIARRDPAASIPWPSIPTVAAMARHLGGVHRWVADVVRSGERAAVHRFDDVPDDALPAWFEDGRAALLRVLADSSPSTPCWVIGDRTGTVEFWRRRMVFEHVKHLVDLRAADGGAWAVAPELEPDDYADGIDELLTVFLPRSRPRLPPLPGPVGLIAGDGGRSWRIGTDWTISPTAPEGGAAEGSGARGSTERGSGAVSVTAGAGDLALMLWERADLLDPRSGAAIDGSRATLRALQTASVHPW